MSKIMDDNQLQSILNTFKLEKEIKEIIIDFASKAEKINYTKYSEKDILELIAMILSVRYTHPNFDLIKAYNMIAREWLIASEFYITSLEIIVVIKNCQTFEKMEKMIEELKNYQMRARLKQIKNKNRFLENKLDVITPRLFDLLSEKLNNGLDPFLAEKIVNCKDKSFVIEKLYEMINENNEAIMVKKPRHLILLK